MTDRAAALLPCPFCGGAAVEWDNPIDRRQKAGVRCSSCEVSKEDYDLSDARTQWNQRPHDHPAANTMESGVEKEVNADIPFVEGALAGINGDDPRVCPFGKMTRDWREWNRGQVWGIAAADPARLYDAFAAYDGGEGAAKVDPRAVERIGAAHRIGINQGGGLFIESRSHTDVLSHESTLRLRDKLNAAFPVGE